MFKPKRTSIIVAHRFSIGSFVLKPQCIKSDWRRKSSQNFALFDPPPLQNLGKGWAKCLSELIKFNLGPNLLYTFAESPLRGFGHGLSNG